MGTVSSSTWLFLIYINEMEKSLSLSLSLSLARVGYGSMRNLRFGLFCVFFIVGASSWNTFFSVVAEFVVFKLFNCRLPESHLLLYHL